MEKSADSKSFLTAAWDGDVERVEKELHLGVDIETVGGTHRGTALNCASRNGHIDVVRILLQHDPMPDVDAMNEGWGHSCLHQAASFNRMECIQALLEAGADPTRQVPLSG